MAFDPSANLSLLLSASTGVSVVGGRVASWTDSIAGRVFRQRDDGSKPDDLEMETEAQNGHPAIHFPASHSAYLKAPYLWSGGGARTLCVVYRIENTAYIGWIAGQFQTLDQHGSTFYVDSQPGNDPLFGGWGDSYNLGSNCPQNSFWKICVVTYDGDRTLKLFADGVLFGELDQALDTEACSLTVGGQPDLSGYSICGFVAEVRAYSGCLSEADAAALSQYLQTKYALPPDPDVYLANGAGWHFATADPTYVLDDGWNAVSLGGCIATWWDAAWDNAWAFDPENFTLSYIEWDAAEQNGIPVLAFPPFGGNTLTALFDLTGAVVAMAYKLSSGDWSVGWSDADTLPLNLTTGVINPDGTLEYLGDVIVFFSAPSAGARAAITTYLQTAFLTPPPSSSPRRRRLLLAC